MSHVSDRIESLFASYRIEATAAVFASRPHRRNSAREPSLARVLFDAEGLGYTVVSHVPIDDSVSLAPDGDLWIAHFGASPADDLCHSMTDEDLALARAQSTAVFPGAWIEADRHLHLGLWLPPAEQREHEFEDERKESKPKEPKRKKPKQERRSDAESTAAARPSRAVGYPLLRARDGVIYWHYTEGGFDAIGYAIRGDALRADAPCPEPTAQTLRRALGFGLQSLATQDSKDVRVLELTVEPTADHFRVSVTVCGPVLSVADPWKQERMKTFVLGAALIVTC